MPLLLKRYIMSTNCPLNSNRFWKVIVAFIAVTLAASYFYNKHYNHHSAVLYVKSKTFFINEGDIDGGVVKPDRAVEMIQRQRRLMHPGPKKSATKFPKLIDKRFNAQKITRITEGDFGDLLQKQADEQKRVILAVVDSEYLSFAMNFYQLSILRHKLSNFLFITLDADSEKFFKEHNIPCYTFPFSAFLVKSLHASNFGTRSFNYKTNMKSAVMVQALRLGVEVLMVDVDVIFFKNPLPFLHCPNCSMLVQQDRQLYNSGFVYAKATGYSQQVYERAWDFFVRLQRSHDQSYFNMAIQNLEEEEGLMQLQVLSKTQFPCGLFYFEHTHRPFENLPACADCVLVHNNYLGSRAAKLYRLRENLMWVLDEGEYYSNTSAKFLTYHNPLEFDDTLEKEVGALKSAMVLAAKLDRLLVLPSFHCCSCVPAKTCSHPRYRCSLLSVLRLSSFEWTFEGRYREHSFFKNPLVPPTLLESSSPALLINHSVSENLNTSGLTLYTPSNSSISPSLDDVSQWLWQYRELSVIHFHSLYDTKMHERVSQEDFRIHHLLYLMKDTFQCTEYQQWEKNVLKF